MGDGPAGKLDLERAWKASGKKLSNAERTVAAPPAGDLQPDEMMAIARAVQLRSSRYRRFGVGKPHVARA